MLREVMGEKVGKIEAQDLMLILTASVLAVTIGIAVRMAYELGRLENFPMQNATQVASRKEPE